MGNVEWGNHDDVFQSVWVGDNLYFRKNYLHDFGGQGFFVKDQPSAIDGIVVEDNLIVRQNLPCDPTSLCPTWQLSPFQVFGPLKDVSIRHNTVWPGSGGGTQWLRGSGWSGPTVVSDNVFSNLNSDASGLTNGYSGSNNTNCGGSGFPSTGLASDCSPAFADAANGDYRVANGRGVTWRVADQQYGPGASSTPPVEPPPTDTTPPGTSISSGPANPTTSTSASFAFTATQSGSTFECKLDAGAYATCTSPKSYSGLSVGSHTFSVRAIDPAGNTDATPATRTWTIAPSDTTPPDTTITSGPDASTLSTSAIVRVHRERRGRDVRVQARREQLRGVHEPEGLQRPEHRRAHVHACAPATRRATPTRRPPRGRGRSRPTRSPASRRRPPTLRPRSR